MVTLFKEIDIIQTKRNARKVLGSYRRLDRIAGRSLIDIKSPTITDMPKSDSYGNKTEDALLQHAEAEWERDAILVGIMALGLVSRQILHYSYCSRERMTNYAIGNEIGYSQRSVERMKQEAIIEFADAYRNGALISYR